MAKILLIEDYHIIRELYFSLLQKKGHKIDVATDGEEGLEKIKKGNFDLILLNLVLPKLSGLDILRKLKGEGEIEKHGKIIVLATLGEEDEVKLAKEYGAFGDVLKSTLHPEKVVEDALKFLG